MTDADRIGALEAEVLWLRGALNKVYEDAARCETEPRSANDQFYFECISRDALAGLDQRTCSRCGFPVFQHRPEKQAHHSECTLEEFSAMTDNEITVFCAEKVMGWRRYKGDRWAVERWMAEDGSGARISWAPLESISDAWMLAEKAISDGKYPSVWYEGQWVASIRIRDSAITATGMAEADTAPRALAIAIARAYGAKP